MSNEYKTQRTLEQLRYLHGVTNDTLKGLIDRVERLEGMVSDAEKTIKDLQHSQDLANDALGYLTEGVESLSEWRKNLLEEKVRVNESLLASEEAPAGTPDGDRVSVDHPGPCFARCTEEIKQGDQLHYYEEGGEGFVRKALGEELVVGHALAPAREDGNGGMIVRFQPHAPSKSASTAPPKKGGAAAEPRADVGRGDVDDLPRPGTFWKRRGAREYFLIEVKWVTAETVEYAVHAGDLIECYLDPVGFLEKFRPVHVRPVVEVEITGKTLAAAKIPRDGSVQYVIDPDLDLRRVADSSYWDIEDAEWVELPPGNEHLSDRCKRIGSNFYYLPVRSVRWEEVE